MPANANVDDTAEGIRARGNEKIRRIIEEHRDQARQDIDRRRRQGDEEIRRINSEVEEYAHQRVAELDVVLRQRLDAAKREINDELRLANFVDQDTGGDGNGLDALCTNLYNEYYRPPTSMGSPSTQLPTHTKVSPELGGRSPSRDSFQPRNPSSLDDEWSIEFSSDDEILVHTRGMFRSHPTFKNSVLPTNHLPGSSKRQKRKKSSPEEEP
ncbi:hypothetical protein F4821DRAFT_237728 [Hypoxylon rubiginosum]|uniref:Uncharacterized protein n=1 Tax=Hypoxylon rubiginosum TaxID=110542 RepID=A0ACC0D219_9PEZI|nr:hypothetical protein F4821DRAFT_237728 [Hypoxylon rubiginosum]